MQNVVLIQCLESINKLFEYSESLSLGQVSFGSYQILESSSLAVFVNQVDVSIRFDHFNKVDDVNVVLQQLEDFNFVTGEFDELVNLLEFGQRYHFYGHIDFGVDVEGLEDFAVLSLAQILGQSVVINDF